MAPLATHGWLAHGIGERTDLPLPGELVLQAGGFVVLASFLLVGLAWRRPRFGLPSDGRSEDGGSGGSERGGNGPSDGGPGDGGPGDGGPGDGGPGDGRRVGRGPGEGGRGADGRGRLVGQGVLLALLGYLVVVAFVGPAEDETNPAPRALYVLLWVGLVPASLVFGPVWRTVNPLRALHRIARFLFLLPAGGVRPMPRWLGYHPAAVGLALFVWLELVPADHTDPPVVGTFLLAYALLVTAAAGVYGEGFFAVGDPFEVYSTLIGTLAPLRGTPLRALARIAPAPGLVAVLAVWWGSTVFDGVSGVPGWAAGVHAFADRVGVPAAVLSTAALLGLIAVVAAGYRLTTGAAAPALVSTLVPIAVGYTVAHYASLLITEGPRSLAQLAQPGTEGPSTALPAPVVIAVIQVAAVLLGHVLGVVAAHDRVLALAERPPAALDDGRETPTHRPETPAPDRAPGIPETARPALRRVCGWGRRWISGGWRSSFRWCCS